MTDNIKQEAVNKFKEILKTDMGEMLAGELSDEEIDVAIMREVGDMMNQISMVNNISADIAEDAQIAVGDIRKAEKEVTDLKRQLELREDLGIAV